MQNVATPSTLIHTCKKEFLDKLRDSQILNKNSALWRKRVSEWVVNSNDIYCKEAQQAQFQGQVSLRPHHYGHVGMSFLTSLQKVSFP
jgi:hypothetical protein